MPATFVLNRAASNARSLSFCSAVRFTGVSTCTRQNRSPRPLVANRAYAFAAQPEHAARLRLGRHLEHDVAVERRHVDGAAEHRRREAHRHLAAQVLAFAREDRVVA